MLSGRLSPRLTPGDRLVHLLYALLDNDEQKSYMSTKKCSNMICENCKTDREEKDFLPNQDFCYRCVYELKRKSKKCPYSGEKRQCRICSKEVVFDENAKKRQRSVFCSCECAQQGHRDMSNNHWTRKLRSSSPLFP